MLKFKVNKNEEGQTLEKYVKKVLSNVPLSAIYRLFRKKDIKVNGHWEETKYIVKSDEEISIYIKDDEYESYQNDKKLVAKDEISEMIIYEDNNILILNKPRGLLVQKGNDKYSKTLDQMVLEYLYFKKEYDPQIDLAFTPGPAHRLDRNTSGIMIFGKNIETLQYLFQILKDREDIKKHYIALVKGVIREDGIIEAPLKKDLSTGKVVVDSIKDGAKKAKTIYHVLRNYNDYTLLDLTLVTGRTHQLRVHLQYIGHPIVGDTKYGDFEVNKVFWKTFSFKNQFLHSNDITFGNMEYPLENLKHQTFEADLPKEYIKILSTLWGRIWQRLKTII